MLGSVFAGAFALSMYAFRSNRDEIRPLLEEILTGDDRSFDVTTSKLWDNMNRGVRYSQLQKPCERLYVLTAIQRQWKDIKAKYLEGAEEEE